MTKQAVEVAAHPWCWLWLALTALLAFSPITANSQGSYSGIVYGRLYTPPPHVPGWETWDNQGLRVLTLNPYPPVSYGLDLNGDGLPDFTFVSSDAFQIVPAGGNAVVAVHHSSSDLGGYVIPLAPGYEIGPDPQSYEWVQRVDTPFGSIGSLLTASTTMGGSIGYFTGVESAYAGIQFQVDGQTHYGWVRVGAPLVGINGGWVYDYAYQTAQDTPIFAGQVPEPSAATLLFLFLSIALRFRPKRPRIIR